MLSKNLIDRKLEAMVINIFNFGQIAGRTHPHLRDFWNDKIQRHQDRLAEFLEEQSESIRR